jgi:hypothetical protein
MNEGRGFESRPVVRMAAACAACVLGMTLSMPASAGTTTWTGTENSGAANEGVNTGTDLGSLVLTANLDLTDNLGTNSSATNQTTIDDWTFSVSVPATIGSTTTGDEVDLTQMTFSGVLDSVVLYSGTPGSGSVLASATISNNTFAGLAYDVTTSGNYYIEVMSTLQPSNTGSYTGTLLVAAQAIPEPSTVSLLSVSALGLVLCLRRRRYSAM